MIAGEGFFAVLCCSGPLLIGSTVCVRHIHVDRLEFKMAHSAYIANLELPKRDENDYKNINLGSI